MTGSTVTKRKLTLAQAAEQWTAAKAEQARQKALMDEAAEVLLDYFDRTGRASYKQIGWTRTGGSLVLDQAKVRAFLGARLREFQTLTRAGRALKLLG